MSDVLDTDYPFINAGLSSALKGARTGLATAYQSTDVDEKNEAIAGVFSGLEIIANALNHLSRNVILGSTENSYTTPDAKKIDGDEDLQTITDFIGV